MLPQPTSTSNGLMKQKSMLLLGKLLRTKEPEIEQEVDKKKLLTTSDLCSLGVGSCVGTGMYLVSGLVIRNYAGPSALISFVIAAIASLLSGVCYAEFGVRIPQSTGTAYHYSYASVGEFVAFIIGWNLILEYMISSAAGASAIGAAIDVVFNGALSGFSNSAMDLVMRNDGSASKSASANVADRSKTNKFTVLSHQRDSLNGQSELSTFERYSLLFDGSTYRPDFIAAVLCLFMTLILISGVKKSVKFNNYLNLFNAGVFLFILLSALPLMSLKYWKTDFYNNYYNATPTNHLNRSRNVQMNRSYDQSQRLPYYRGLINGEESRKENNFIFDRHLSKHLVKRSMLSNNFDSINRNSNNNIHLKQTNKNSNSFYNLRTKFKRLIRRLNQRLKRSLSFDEDNRKKGNNEHESRMAGFGDDDEEDDEPSIVTPAPKYRTTTTTTSRPTTRATTTTTTTTPQPTTPMKIELPTFRTMIRFTTSTTTFEPYTEEEPITFYTTKSPISTSTSTRQTTSTTTEKLTTSTARTPSTSSSKPFWSDSDEDEEETTTTTEATTEKVFEEEEEEEEEATTPIQEVSKEEDVNPPPPRLPIAKVPIFRSTTERSTVIRSTTQKSRFMKAKAKGIGKGKTKAKVKEIKKPENVKSIESGFMPYGWQGVFRGAATCFYGYIGFDIISSTGGQTEHPTRSIPIAMVSATLITLAVYIVTTLLVSLTTPTHLVSASTALVNIFDYHQKDFVKSVAACGAISSLTVAMFGSMFPMPRVVSAMAQDGMLPRKLAEINYYTGTTVFSTLLLGTITSMIALIFPLQVLVEIMSIGTLMAYTLISICILILRYQPTRENANDQMSSTNNNSLINCLPEQYRNQMIPEGERYYQQMMLNNKTNKASVDLNPFIQDQKAKKLKNKRNLRKFKSFNSSEDSEDYDLDINRNGNMIGQQQKLQRADSKDDDEDEDDEYLVDETTHNYNYGSVPYQYGGSSGRQAPLQFAFLEKFLVYWFPYGWRVPGPATEETSFYVMKLLALYCVLVCLVDAILAFGNLTIDKHLLCFILLILLVSLIFTLFTIARQPQTKLNNLKFKAPGLPYVPAFAILINIYLIFRLSYLTLIRFMIWIVLGLIIYFLYSIKNSSLEQLYCNVQGNDSFNQQQQSSPYDSTQHYQQSPFDTYQTATENNEQSIELKSRQNYMDSSTRRILTTTDSNPFLQTDFDMDDQYSKYANNNLNLSSIDEGSITEDGQEDETAEGAIIEEAEYDSRKNPFLMDYY